MAKAPADIRSLARQHTGTALQTLARIAGDVNAPEAAQVAAANSLLDRGWGKAPVTLDDEAGKSQGRLVIVGLVDA